MGMAFDPIMRVRIGITADGKIDVSGNTSQPFPVGVEWVRASDYDKMVAETELANKLLLKTVADLLTWRKNIDAFTEPDASDG